MKQNKKEAVMPPAKVLAELNNYMIRLKGTRPMLNLHPADKKISKTLRESAAFWFSKSPAMIHTLTLITFYGNSLRHLLTRMLITKQL